uniref:Zinc finger piccolo-type domain-containing protein n=1 Tax=Anabas testudineus TaxID=64144 RepID=A0A7N6ADE5_ANATE
MQRALSASELTGPQLKPQGAASKTSPSVAQMSDTLQKKGSPIPGSPKRAQPTTVTQTAEATKRPESDRQTSPAPSQKTTKPEPKQSKVTPDTQQESGNMFGLGGLKKGPDASKTTESTTGKMFGFGSSIFSSASSLISSAVPDDLRTTPPGSRKMSAPAQVSPKMSAPRKMSPNSTPTVSPKMSPAREPKPLVKNSDQDKKTEESPQSKEDKAPSQPPKAITGQTTCPLCKVELNIGSKDPPNFNTCTECKTTVCNQCGFNPMPIGEVKEWLCLNCQMKRAIVASEPSGPPTMKSQTSPSKVPSPASVPLKDSSKPTTPQKKDSSSPIVKKDKSEPISSQVKQLTPSVKSGKPEAAAEPVKQASPTPHKKTQEAQKTGPERPLDQATPNKSPDPIRKAEHETGGFFGFGGGKSQPAKPAESVSGKMLGFSSSIFSSASTLITSAVQDQPKTTPPVSPKMSAAKEIKSPVLQKKEEQKKTEQPQQQSKTSPLVQAKVDKEPSEHTKAALASQATVTPGQSTCPLCKVELNMGSKHPPNYNTCTECKNTVCNQCGFNPMPNVSEVSEIHLMYIPTFDMIFTIY